MTLDQYLLLPDETGECTDEESLDRIAERYEEPVNPCPVHSHAYSEIYQQVAAGNEEGVRSLMLAWGNYVTIAEAFYLMQTTVCLMAAKKVAA